MEDLVQSVVSCWDISPSASLSSQSSKFALLHKNNAKSLIERQNERRLQRLQRQKRRREALFSDRRHSSDSIAVCDVTQIAQLWNAEEEEDEVMDCSASKEVKHHKKTAYRPYRDILMLSEWMVEIPPDLVQNWLLIVCPNGKRCSVVCSNGQTRAFGRNGFEFLTKFPSLLPGGNRKDRTSFNDNAILDCIFSESEKCFYVLDIILWNGLTFYGCTTEFRFYWLSSKNEELGRASKISNLNKYLFHLLPHYSCTKGEIEKTVAETAFPSGVDGYLFMHKECCYECGVTPLASWLTREMLEQLFFSGDSHDCKENKMNC